ncbi:hypothetical protein [Actinoplanes sp. L3-i22]|uniref:hypothetical protein n=1 Tax=Actinoplanes sp. L3-i22 TaxID=2836373 RepID=UPI001C78A136|nr:hypothetical protein [Actinoplanes sp. L3-i22]BCY07914.1 hypothetical protein L3i22_030020 [Actinoplanes sp. L3-i22]
MSTDNDPAPPSPDWELAGRRVIRFAVAYAVAAAAVVPLFNWATARPYEGIAIPALLILGNIVTLALTLGSLLGLLVCVVVWLVQTSRLEFGAPAGGHLGYWGIVGFGLLLVVSYLQPPALDLNTRLLMGAGERVLGVTLLIIGVAHTRRWIGRRAGDWAPDDAEVHLSSRPTADDWKTDWDPDVARDIERRRSR